MEAAGGVTSAIAQLSQAFGLGAGDCREKVDAEIFSDSLIAASEWAAIAAAIEQGGPQATWRPWAVAAYRHWLGAICERTVQRDAAASVGQFASGGSAL